jgi:3-deoxy-D-manno-octulosonate 8-phosphate phosphatase (KDO 8-P phosphatase)
MNYKIKLRNITTFAFDVDGVLTNGDVTLYKGEVIRTLNSRDGYALQHAAKEGYRILIITGGSSEEVQRRLLDLGATEVRLKSANKLEVYKDLKAKYGFEDEQVLYMGDDIQDIPVLKTVGVSTCPQDAAVEVKEIVDYHSPYNGGKHCVRDVIEQTLRVQGKWMTNGAYSW